MDQTLTRRAFVQSGAAAALPAAPRPNVLFIMADQLRFDCVGANGNPLIRTPNIDRLAAQSARFVNAFVQAPVCVPSRISYFTGRYPHSHRNRVNYTPCDSREVMMQRILREAGYQTGSVGKLHFWPPTAEHARTTGFDQVLLDDGVPYLDAYSDYVKWRKQHDLNAATHYRAVDKSVPAGRNPYRGLVPYEFTPTCWTGEQTCRMLREFASSRRPFFLFSSFFKPHSPHVVPAPLDSMYDAVEIPLPPRTTLEDIRRLPLPLQKMLLFNRSYDMDRARLQWIYRTYYAAVSMVDREVGRVLDELERSGMAADTIVMLASDHGDQLLEHGALEKNVFFEGSVHVPLLLRLPGRVAAGARAELVETVDVLPTLLDLCGVPAPTNCQGRAIAASAAPPREFVFSENVIPVVYTHGKEQPFVPGRGVDGIRHPDAKMVRSQRWKLTHYPGYGGELYDLRNDPGELRNLYADPAHQPTVQELRGALLDWMVTADENDQIAPRWMVQT